MGEIEIVVSKNETRQFSNEAHFLTTLPVHIPEGRYRAQVFKVGEGSVSSLRIILVEDRALELRPQQSLL